MAMLDISCASSTLERIHHNGKYLRSEVVRACLMLFKQ
ncbi:hypothetical protein CFBP3846_P500027 (plasmid) [Pseudomonas syringae pv. avii]|uniref:Uncharacterized protein n=1 Tax=Pseudomonas syringae pv. avii TaxID=663959 RepID=A0ABY1UG58_PSESX|nr:hypothetical protein CFBP3846_P500027 [Pseudomonas syringae pv. avii]